VVEEGGGEEKEVRWAGGLTTSEKLQVEAGVGDYSFPDWPESRVRAEPANLVR
jgi:hypothetical protein